MRIYMEEEGGNVDVIPAEQFCTVAMMKQRYCFLVSTLQSMLLSQTGHW